MTCPASRINRARTKNMRSSVGDRATRKVFNTVESPPGLVRMASPDSK